MKKIFSTILALTVAAFTFTSCEDIPAPYEIPGQSGGNTSGGGSSSATITPTGIGTQADPFNVAAIKSVAEGLAQGETGTTNYYFTGIVSSIKEISTSYGNASFYISDNGETDGQFYIYHAYGLNNQKITNENLIQVGDTVTIYGLIMNYNGTIETSGNKAYIYSIKGKNGSSSSTGGTDTPSTSTTDPKGAGTQADPYNVAGAIKFISSLAADSKTSETYYVKGKVSKVVKMGTSGSLQFNMSDDGTDSNSLLIYYCNDLDNKAFTSTEDLKVGEEVVVCGTVVNYKGNTPEFNSGSYLVSRGGSTSGGDNTGGTDTPSVGAGGVSISGTNVTLTNAAATAGTETIKLDLSTLGLANGAEATTYTLTDGTIVSFDANGEKNPPKYYDATKGVRVYAREKITINGKTNIASVVFECDSYSGTDYVGNPTATVIFDGNTVVYNNAIETGSGVQLRVKTITITYAK